MLYISLALFLLTYVLMIVFQNRRTLIALTSALIFIISGLIPYNEIIPSINFNVLMMIAGTMGTVALMIESKMPQLLADLLIEKVPNVKMAIVVLSLFSGIVSAFIDNVATVLIVAPIALSIAKKQNINPIGMILAIAVSSNLQGAATLVGDTTSILLGGYANMNFLDFFWYKGEPGIFFAVELGAICATSILLIIFKKETAPIKINERTIVEDKFPTILMILNILLLIVASFIPNTPDCINGLICIGICLIGLIYRTYQCKKISSNIEILKEIDFETIGLLLGLFIVIGGIKACGVIDALANLFTKLGNGNLFIIYTIITWASVLISAFIDNIPYVATMLPVVASLATQLNVDPTLLYFGLLSGATLGGNITPIGASANITGIGILKKAGFEVKNSDFFKIGIPFTLCAIIPAYIFFLVFYY